jgi:type IV secretory pathway TraG/TraD family ATPase VirD4
VRYEMRWGRVAEVLVYEAACKANWTEVAPPCRKKNNAGSAAMVAEEGRGVSARVTSGLAAWTDAVGAACTLESRQDVRVR